MSQRQRPTVLLMHSILEPGPSLLAEEVDVVNYPPHLPLDEEHIAEAARDCAGILSQLMDPIGDRVLSVPGLKVVANCAVGFENIDVAAATRRGVMVTNTPGVLDQTTADFAFALLMAASRRVVQGDHFVRDGHFKGWAIDMLLGRDVHSATLGIVGMGRIGRELARRARGFDMRILYHDAMAIDSELERTLNASRVALDDLLRQADFVTLHVPLSPATHHLIGARELALMKPSAVLVNTSRGPVVDEAALAEALKTHRLFAAGLDVYENEPEISPALRALYNVILTPHIASASVSTRAEMSQVAARNLLVGVRGGRPANLVNREVAR